MAGEAVINAIAEQQWLEDSADPLQKAIRSLFGKEGAGRMVKDALHGVWLGHPLHAVLTDIPLGSWTMALVLDALDFDDAADVAVGVGLAGAVASAVTGATDWSETDGRAKKIGLVHGVLNLAVASLYTASLVARRSKRREAGVSLSMLGYAIGSVSAWLGGHLAYGEQIGVDHTATADASKPENFTPVIAESALQEGKPTRVEANGVRILLVRLNGEIHAISDTCPHLGGPLSEGKLVGDVVECPWHGSRFRVEDGSVVGGPATQPARCYDVRVAGGDIEVKAR